MTDIDRILANFGLDALPHESLQQTLRYWDLCRGERAMPARGDIDPRDIPYLLSGLMIVDRGPHGGYAVVRLAGTRIVDAFGFDPTGHDLLQSPEMTSLSTLCRTTVTNAAPLYAEGELSWSAVMHKPYCALYLPLSENGESVDKLLISFHFPERREIDDLFGDQPARQSY